jgi:hypothetical protein
MPPRTKNRIEELSELIEVAQREAAKARERGADAVADSYAGVASRWRAERDRLLEQRPQATMLTDGAVGALSGAARLDKASPRA